VELDLPTWTAERDIDLRNWLFGFGAGIRIDSPQALRDEHRQKLETALAVYQAGRRGALQCHDIQGGGSWRGIRCCSCGPRPSSAS